MKIKIGFLTVCTLLAWLLTNSLYAVAGFIAATLHELGHIGMARLLGIPFRELNVTPFGAALTPSTAMGSYTDEVLIAAAGPAVNLLSALIILPWTRSGVAFPLFFLISSLFLAILNLLPVSGFDGGRILSCLLCKHCEPLVAERILGVSSFVIVFALWCLSVYLLLRIESSLSLFVFSCSLFLKLFVNPEKSL